MQSKCILPSVKQGIGERVEIIGQFVACVI